MQHLWGALLELLFACTLQENENLAQVAISSLQDFFKQKGSVLTEEMWLTFFDHIGAAIKANFPCELLKLTPDDALHQSLAALHILQAMINLIL